MAIQLTLDRFGVIPMDRCQVGMVPGPQPLSGPPHATGDSTVTAGPRVTWSKATGSPQLKLAQWNAEGIRNKKTDLQNFLRQNSIDICCVQETHLTSSNQRFSIRGYEGYRQDRDGRSKGGILTLVKNSLPSSEHCRSQTGDTEYIAVKVIINQDITVTVFNLYSPSDRPIQLDDIEPSPRNWIILGDFNSHSPSWGYTDTDARGEEVESWSITNGLVLINRPDDPPTCYSRAWRTCSTPDIAFATDDLHSVGHREVCPQLGGSDHKPVIIHLHQEVTTGKRPRLQPSWNYKKADWELFKSLTDTECSSVTFSSTSVDKNIKSFNSAVLAAAKCSIPRGKRSNYQPFWSQQLQDLEEQVTTARDKMEADPSDDNVIDHNKKRAEFIKTKSEEIRRSWHEKTESLNLEQDSQRLWRLTKSLNEEQPTRSKTVLDVNGQLLHGKAAANCFAEAYHQQSTVKMAQQRIQAVHDETERCLSDSAPNSIMDDSFTMAELNTALRSLKAKKAPGPDGISNDMLRHLGPAAKALLLQIFNQSWEQAKVPTLWKEAHITPILKKGKPKSNPSSYRPISLLSCVGKVLERLINRRLMWHLESNNLLSPTQTGYRRHRSTEDQLALLAQEVENGFQEKKKTLAVFFDLTQAFDKVWRKGLLLKILQMGVSGNMYWWIKHFLLDRTARVKLDGILSHRTTIREGVPQGGVISPTLFLIFINDLTACIPRHVSNTLHADDLAVWTSSEHTSTATYRLQETVNTISDWTETWGLTISKTKTCTMLFSLSTKKEEVHLKLGDVPIPRDDTPTFLGVKLDARLTWKPHIDSVRTRAIRRLALMKKLAGTTWGANAAILKQVYTGYIRPVMEYSSQPWSTAANNNKSRLDRVQNWGLRMVLGAMKSTPITDLEKTADIQPLETRRQTKILTQTEKMKRLPSHPLHSRLNEHTKNRLKRQSLNHLSKDLGRAQGAGPHPHTEPAEDLAPETWPPIDLEADIRVSIPGIHSKDSQIPAAQRALALEYLDREYPAASWIHVYTDGSATDASRNGGSGVLFRQPGQEPTTLSLPAGCLCSNFRAEVTAITAAIHHLNTSESVPQDTVILTDSLSTLQALTSSNADQTIRELHASIQQLCRQRRIVLQWIPAHCGIPGNEHADRLAKAGSMLQQPRASLSYREAKTVLKQQQRSRWRQKNGGYSPQSDSIMHLDRRGATIIYRLRTGHCRLRAHLKRLHLADSALCACTHSDQTPTHILQDCPLYTSQRNQAWPHGADLNTKLWGSVADLHVTIHFVTATGLTI